jgi:hypothetical protein
VNKTAKGVSTEEYFIDEDDLKDTEDTRVLKKIETPNGKNPTQFPRSRPVVISPPSSTPTQSTTPKVVLPEVVVVAKRKEVKLPPPPKVKTSRPTSVPSERPKSERTTEQKKDSSTTSTPEKKPTLRKQVESRPIEIPAQLPVETLPPVAVVPKKPEKEVREIKHQNLDRIDDIVCEMKASLLIEDAIEISNRFYRLVIPDSSELERGYSVYGQIFEVKIPSEQTAVLTPINPDKEIDVLFSLSDGELVIEGLTKGLQRGKTHFESILSFQLNSFGLSQDLAQGAIGKVSSYDFLGDVRAELSTLKIDSEANCIFSRDGIRNLELFNSVCEQSSMCTTSSTSP